MQVEERMENRIQLQAIYTCAGQLPSHNRVCAQPPNMNSLMVPGQIAIGKKRSTSTLWIPHLPCGFHKPNM